MALVTANILAVIRAALGGVHGVGKIEAGLSDFYVVDEIQHTYRGMMIAIEPVVSQKQGSGKLGKLKALILIFHVCALCIQMATLCA
jgi:hypothetical protein